MKTENIKGVDELIFRLPDGKTFGLKDTNSIKENPIVQTIDVEKFPIKIKFPTATMTIESTDPEYSTETLLDIRIGHAYRPLLDACNAHNDNISVTRFLLIIFITSLGEDKDHNGGARFINENGQEINAINYVRLLFKKLPATNDKKTLLRRYQIKEYFKEVYKTLTTAGWKENTVFEKDKINEFKEIIVNYKK
jgi:hypothetical protein